MVNAPRGVLVLSGVSGESDLKSGVGIGVAIPEKHGYANAFQAQEYC